MPFSRLTDVQILALLRERQTIESVPGVTLFWVDLIGPRRKEPAIVIHFDFRKLEEISRLPVSIAGVPVVLKLEDRVTSKVLETIDPRDHGGVWPGLYPLSEC